MAMNLRSKQKLNFPVAPPHPARRQPPVRRCTVNDLPDELLINIFAHLNVKELTCVVPSVCRRWNTLSTDASMYQSLMFVDADPPTPVAVRLTSMAPWLKTLHLYERHDADAILRQVGTSNAMLETLVLQECRGSPSRTNLTSQSLRDLIQTCGQLRTLALQDTFCGCMKLYNEIGLNLPQLKHLIIMPSRYFSTEALLNITTNCQSVETLQVYSFDEEGTQLHALITDEAFRAFCERFHASLRIVTVNSALLSDLSAWSLSRCARLATLHLHNAGRVTDDGVMALRSLTALSDLAVSRADLVTTPCWMSFLGCHRVAGGLTRLVLHWCRHVTDDVCKMAVRSMPRLRHLGLAGVNITEQGHLEVLQLLAAQTRLAFTNEHGVFLSNVL